MVKGDIFYLDMTTSRFVSMHTCMYYDFFHQKKRRWSVLWNSNTDQTLAGHARKGNTPYYIIS